jgi:hypothetical protein
MTTQPEVILGFRLTPTIDLAYLFGLMRTTPTGYPAQ